jgi:hypothetical protein
MNEPIRIDPLILTLRGQKVILDADLAGLYGVQTKVLNQAVKRNSDRFPEDLMFRLTEAEKAEVVTNCDHLIRLKFSPQLPAGWKEPTAGSKPVEILGTAFSVSNGFEYFFQWLKKAV